MNKLLRDIGPVHSELLPEQAVPLPAAQGMGGL